MAFLRLLSLCFALMLALEAWAQIGPAPSAAALQARLSGLAQRNLPEAEQRQAEQALREALANLQAADDSAQHLRDLERRLKEAPDAIRAARQEIERLQSASPDQEPAAAAGLRALEQALKLLSSRLNDARNALIEANSQINLAQTRPERAHEEILANQTRLRAIENSLQTQGEEGASGIATIQRDALRAEWKALDANLRLRRQELAGNNLLLDLGQARRDLLNLQVGQLETQVQALQSRINALRLSASQEAVQALTPEAGAPLGSALLQRESERNRELSARLLKTTDELNILTQRGLRVRQQLDQLNQADASLKDQIGVLRGSLLLFRILSQQRQSLPQVSFDRDLTNRIADLRLAQFELGRQRDQLASPTALADRLLVQEAGPEAAAAVRPKLVVLLSSRAELLERLSGESSNLLNEAVALQLNQQQLRATEDKLRQTLEAQMFWSPSNPPLDLEWLRALPGRGARELADIPWSQGWQDVWEGLRTHGWGFLAVVFAAAASFFGRERLLRSVHALGRRVGHVHADGQMVTPAAILLTLLMALPVPLLLALAGGALAMDGRGHNALLGTALSGMAEVWLLFSSASRMLEPEGIAKRHFGWSAPEVAFLRQRMLILGGAVVAMVAVVTVAEGQPEVIADDVLGMQVLLACYAIIAWQMGQLLRKGTAGQRTPPARLLAGLLLALVPLSLIGVLVAGYYYTAVKLAGRLVATLSLLILWRLLAGIVERSLAVEAHRVAWKRALARHEVEGVPAEERGSLLEGARREVEQVNQKSLRLLRLLLLFGLLAGLYAVWADLIGVFSYLQNIVLYTFTSGSGDQAVSLPISLSDLLRAVFVAVLALVLAGNLPSLLEIVVLSRMQLAHGSTYAITTLLSYLIGIVGFIVALAGLGLGWDKLQWLAAALSVGLGFGLQEIVANFVSGLIILFERPMRIGDVVTVGEVSGTVTRIRIRATTITDFDRKEIIVPNKVFVTDQFINWSLTDPVTRITVAVGVAYGSDLPLVRRLLLRVARENPRVLDDPAPQALFMSFGASTLDHELRVHVRSLDDRVPVVDELNRAIDALFAEHGIEIAFTQMDVHLRSGDAAVSLPGLPSGASGTVGPGPAPG